MKLEIIDVWDDYDLECREVGTLDDYRISLYGIADIMGINVDNMDYESIKLNFIGQTVECVLTPVRYLAHSPYPKIVLMFKDRVT
jgi:hypothetical protein